MVPPSRLPSDAPPDPVSAAKQRARSAIRARRRDLVESQGTAGRGEQASALAAAFLTWLREYAVSLGREDPSGLTITAFRALPTEPPVGDLVRTALEAGGRVLLPVTVRGEHELRWVPATPTTGDGVTEEVIGGVRLTGNELGPDALAGVDVALIPGLAVDAAGHRLGQGGGYYDRALPLLRPDVPVIVALHDHEVPSEEAARPVPHAGHDILVDGVLTTAGVRLLR